MSVGNGRRTSQPYLPVGRRYAKRFAELAEQTLQIEAALEAPVAPDASSVEAAARRTLLSARRLHVENRTISLQRELVTYDAERPLLPHRRELAARDVARLQEQLSQLDAAVDALRRLDASQQVNEARLQALRLGIAAGGEQADGVRQALLTLAVANNGWLRDNATHDYQQFDTGQKERLAVLVNHVRSLGELLRKEVAL